MSWVGFALLVMVILFLGIYIAVRMAVSDALRHTVREEYLTPPPAPLPFHLDAGDDDHADEGFSPAR